MSRGLYLAGAIMWTSLGFSIGVIVGYARRAKFVYWKGFDDGLWARKDRLIKRAALKREKMNLPG